ncbi:MAG: DUF2071 domain-containing protein [Planctomycetaceae bacterium]|nr:DUF2071 domain-containing protein [Planctomycetaceae bacterium]
MAEKPSPGTIPACGFQRWSDLTFLHWKLDPDQIQTLLPPELTVQTWDGSAWMGVVLFSMERVRPWWSPPVPGISWFLETNVRTYVQHQNGETGVWFFSLDANARVAVTVGRTLWNLNYRLSKMSMNLREEAGNQILHYTGSRFRSPLAEYDITATVSQNEPEKTAVVGTLEYFLAERYRLFAQDHRGELFAGLVDHTPYPVRSAQVRHCTQTLTTSPFQGSECDNPGLPSHAMFCHGVDVRIGCLKKVAS